MAAPSLLLISLLLLLLLASTAEGSPKKTAGGGQKKILVYSPAFGHSHLQWMGNLADLLQRQGHNVTVLVPLTNPTLKNFGVKEARVITVPTAAESAAILQRGEEFGLRAFWEDSHSTIGAIIGLIWKNNNFSTLMVEQCKETIANAKLFEELREAQFDVAITEFYDLCGLGIFWDLGIPRTVLSASCPIHEYLSSQLGLPSSTSFVHTAVGKEPNPDLLKGNRRARATNFFTSWIGGENMFGYLQREEEGIFMERNPAFPGFGPLARSAHFLFENAHPALAFPNPSLRAIVPIGGIAVKETKPLDKAPPPSPHSFIPPIQDIEAILSLREKNVYISFGTVLRTTTAPAEYIERIIDAIRGLPDVTFLWKFDGVLNMSLPSNLHLVAWLDQPSLLAHPRLSLFVTHCGVASVMEAAYGGVPIVAMPIFMDQSRNALMTIKHGVGEIVDKSTLAESGKPLRETIAKVLADVKYKENARLLAKGMTSYYDPEHEFLGKMNYVFSIPPHSPSRSFDNPSSSMSLRGFILEVISIFMFTVTFIGIPSFYLFLYLVISLLRRYFEISISIYAFIPEILLIVGSKLKNGFSQLQNGVKALWHWMQINIPVIFRKIFHLKID